MLLGAALAGALLLRLFADDLGVFLGFLQDDQSASRGLHSFLPMALQRKQCPFQILILQGQTHGRGEVMPWAVLEVRN